MTHFIDRRLNPKGKSLGNRQRFLRRARAQIREAVQKSLKDAAVARSRFPPRARKNRDSGSIRAPAAITISYCPATGSSSPATRSRSRAREMTAVAVSRPVIPAKARTISSSR